MKKNKLTRAEKNYNNKILEQSLIDRIKDTIKNKGDIVLVTSSGKELLSSITTPMAPRDCVSMLFSMADQVIYRAGWNDAKDKYNKQEE